MPKKNEEVASCVIDQKGIYKVFKPTSKHYRELHGIVLNFLKKDGAPNWYRGISSFQTAAGFRLHNHLRDDYEQNTTHRVYGDLVELGLTPLYPTHDDIHKLIIMSRTNDIAFLWFLWEWFYKSDRGNRYTMNEQLILSTIANLDTLTTLRELDKLLPPPQLPKKIIELRKKAALKQAKTQEKKKVTSKSNPKKADKTLPYFRKLPRPLPYGKALNVNKPDYVVDFKRYNEYKHKDYIAPNESTRWYSSYTINQQNRIVNSILRDDLIFEIPSLTDIVTKPILRATLDNVFKTSRVPSPPLLCKHHKEEMEANKFKRMERLVKQRETCLKILDTERYRREKRKERILRELEDNIEKFVLKYRKKLAKSCRDCVAELLSETFICAIHVVDDMCLDDEPCGEVEAEQSVSIMSGDMLIEKYSSTQKIKYEHREPGMHDYDDSPNCDTTTSSSSTNPKGGGYCRHYPISKKEIINLTPNICYIEDDERFNYGHQHVSTPTPSKLYFESTKQHVPFHFNYGKIFCFKSKSDSSLNIKKYIVEALDGKVEPCKTLHDSPPKTAKAVDDYAKEVFKRGAAIKGAQMAKEAERRSNIDDSGRLRFDQDYFDPDDRELMVSMLKIAFEHMRKSKKFVLVSLPNAYTLPLLVEWISARYGKVYSVHQQLESYRFSKKLFNIMDKITPGKIRAPAYREIGDNQFLSYSCHDYLIKKLKRAKRKYFRRCYAAIMEQTRILWFIMRPFLCTMGPPKKQFYSYMPPRMNDINIFRCWRPSEFRNIRQLRYERIKRESA